MTLKSALQDVKDTTLAAVGGLLGKLRYLASLRHEQGRYRHWGMSLVHGSESSERALKAAHAEVITDVLRTPLASLVDDLHESSQSIATPPDAYVEQMRGEFDALLPGERKDAPAASHLNSVLVALSELEKKSQANATRSTS
jgi:hypothetical protein